MRDERMAAEWVELGAGDREAHKRKLSRLDPLSLARVYRRAANLVEEFPESPIHCDQHRLVIAELRSRGAGR